MAKVLYSDLRKGMYVVLAGELHLVADRELRTPGNLPSKLRLWLRKLRTGTTADVRVHPDDRVEVARVETRPVQFLFRDGPGLVLMDRETFDQHAVPAPLAAEAVGYLKEGDPATLLTHDGRPIALELPPIAELTVADTEPAVKRSTASAVFKPAVLETGLRVTVPGFVEIGEVIAVDTRTGEYAGRR